MVIVQVIQDLGHDVRTILFRPEYPAFLFMKILEKCTIGVGCIGISLNILGLLFSNDALNFSSVFLGHLAALLFTIAIDTNRAHYYFPLIVSLTNIFINSQELLFVELLSQSIVYQISAYKLFAKGSFS